MGHEGCGGGHQAWPGRFQRAKVVGVPRTCGGAGARFALLISIAFSLALGAVIVGYKNYFWMARMGTPPPGGPVGTQELLKGTGSHMTMGLVCPRKRQALPLRAGREGPGTLPVAEVAETGPTGEGCT